MNPRDLIYTTSVEVDEEQARRLRAGSGGRAVEVYPPQNRSVPATLDQFTKAIYEPQTKYFGIKNTSPVAAFEIRRAVPDELSLQFVVPTKRLERKVRTQLKNEVPEVGFGEGTLQIPVGEGCTIGGGLLSTGRRDWYPLETEFDQPPNNSVISALHRHAMRDTQFIIQILFQPVVGQPIRSWWWRKRAYQRRNYLKKEKEKLWGSRSPTKRERRQADSVENKAGAPRYKVSLRFLIINADDYVRSRVKELAGAFNVYENPDTGQYLNAETATTLRESELLTFGQAVSNREFDGWSRSFQVTRQELAGLLSLPAKQQSNLKYAAP